MELWFIYALLGTVASGAVTFLQKVGTHYQLSSLTVTKGLQVGQLVLATGAWLLLDQSLVEWQLIAMLGFLTGIIYTLVHWLRALSLENIDTTIFFPLNKFIGPSFVALGGIFFIGESVNTFEVIGIFIGATVPLLLIDKFESSRQTNLSKGLWLMLVGTLISVVGIFISRIGAISEGSIWLYIIVQGLTGAIFAQLIGMYLKKKEESKDKNDTRALSLGIAAGFVLSLSIFWLLKSFETGLISVAYTVNSFYILVPIVLSVVIFKEHINLRKILAIIFSIVAVIFFQI